MTEVLCRQIVPRFVEVPRKPLEKALASRQKKLMVQAFYSRCGCAAGSAGTRFPGRRICHVLTGTASRRYRSP